MFDKESGMRLLVAAGVFYGCEDDEDPPEYMRTLNMNDVWGWALAWGEEVPEEEVPLVAELFYRYGWCGILYWASERHDQMKSEFFDNNRFIEFVRNEELIRKEVPDYNRRAYHREKYEIGE